MTNQQYIENLYKSNYQRTEYILKHYLQFKALEVNVDNNVSRAFFELLLFQMEGKDIFDNKDKQIITKTGPYIVKAIEEAINTIRSFPREISCHVYPVIYYYFMCEASRGMHDKVKELMLINEGIVMTDEEIYRCNEKGIKMLSALLFDKKEIRAIEEGFNLICKESDNEENNQSDIQEIKGYRCEIGI